MLVTNARSVGRRRAVWRSWPQLDEQLAARLANRGPQLRAEARHHRENRGRLLSVGPPGPHAVDHGGVKVKTPGRLGHLAWDSQSRHQGSGTTGGVSG